MLLIKIIYYEAEIIVRRILCRLRSIQRTSADAGKFKPDPYSVKYYHHNIPGHLQTGTNYNACIVVQNIGSETWQSYHRDGFETLPYIYINGYHVGYGWFNRNIIAPGERSTVSFHIPLPEMNGKYKVGIAFSAQKITPFREKLELSIETISSMPQSGVATAYDIKLFNLLYIDFHILPKRLLWYFYKALLNIFKKHHVIRNRIQKKWKELNKLLAHLESHAKSKKTVSLPYNVVLETTSKCNMRCASCLTQTKDQNYSKGEMSEEILYHLIEELFPTAVSVNISLAGEPLLSPYLKKIIHKLWEHDCRLSMITNGTLLDSEGLLPLIMPVLEHLEISVDSVEPELFRKLRSNAKLEHIIENAKKVGNFLAANPDCSCRFGFSMTLYKCNLSEIPEMLKLVSEVNGTFLRASIGVAFSNEDVHLSVFNSPELYNEMYEISKSYANSIGIELSMPLPFADEYEPPYKTTAICPWLYHHTRVLHDGRFNVCLHKDCPVSLQLNGKSFKKVWNSVEMQTLRYIYDTSSCPSSCSRCYAQGIEKENVWNRKKRYSHPL